MSKKKKNHKKHSTVSPYFRTPLTFLVISMIIIIPLSFGLLKLAVNTVHKAQKTLVFSAADVAIDRDNYKMSEEIKDIPKINSCQKIGRIECKNAGLNTEVFMGNNRVSRREGAGLSFNAAMPGQDKEIKVFGNALGAFKALYNVKAGDVISFETGWGIFSYKVSEIVVSKEAPKDSGKERLVLITAKSKEPFAAFSEEELYVIAEKEEVQQ